MFFLGRRCVNGETAAYAGLQAGAARLIKEHIVSYEQPSEDLGVHPTQLRNLVKQLADDLQHAFSGQGQTKEQLEIAQFKRSVADLSLKRQVLAEHSAIQYHRWD